MDANYGYVKVIAEPKRGRILGAEIVGKDAGELIHAFSGPLAMRATVFDLLRAPWYHPTLAEIITYPLEEIAGPACSIYRCASGAASPPAPGGPCSHGTAYWRGSYEPAMAQAIDSLGNLSGKILLGSGGPFRLLQCRARPAHRPGRPGGRNRAPAREFRPHGTATGG
jgi:hypothetical protein